MVRLTPLSISLSSIDTCRFLICKTDIQFTYLPDNNFNKLALFSQLKAPILGQSLIYSGLLCLESQLCFVNVCENKSHIHVQLHFRGG